MTLRQIGAKKVVNALLPDIVRRCASDDWQGFRDQSSGSSHTLCEKAWLTSGDGLM
jgi:hypothetical protein